MKTGLLLSFALFLTAQTVHAQGIGIGGGGGPAAPVPKKINFQGRVAVDNVNFEGSGQFKFALISTQTSNNPFVASTTTILWTNDGSHLNESVTQVATGEPNHYLTLTVAGGLYSVMLGDSTLFNNGIGTPIPMPALDPSLVLNIDGQPLTNLQLRVWFNDGTHGFQMLAPDQKLTSVVYAFRAAQAAAVDNNSITSDKIAFGAVTELKLANGAVTNSKIADFAITGTNLADGAVSAAKLGDGAVTQKKLGLGYAAGTLLDGNLSTSANALTAQFSYSTLSKTPEVSISSGWSVASASTSGLSVSKTIGSPLAVTDHVQNPSFALVDGLPAVVYEDTTTSTHKLVYMRAQDSKGSRWDTPVILDSSVGNLGLRCSLAVIGGQPAVAYVGFTGSGLVRFIRASDAQGTAWASPSNVATTNSNESYISLVELASGKPGVAYYTNTGLKYATATSVAGTSWTSQVLDSGNGAGRYVSLSVIEGMPAVAYGGANASIARYRRAGDAAGTGAWGDAVDLGAPDAVATNITLLAVNGKPRVSYFDTASGRLKYVRSSDTLGFAWPDPINLAGNLTDTGPMIIIAGSPAIGFVASNLPKFLRSTDANGTAWAAPLVLGDTLQSGSSVSPFEADNGFGIFLTSGGNLGALGFSLKWSASDGTVAPLMAATVQPGGVGTAQLASGAVTLDKLDTAVRSSLLPGEGAITTSMLANFAVTTAKLDQNAVQAGQLDENAVITSKLADGAVTTAKIASAAVTAQEIAGGAVHTSQLALGAVTPGQIALGAVTPSKISATGTFTFEAVSTGVLTITGGADVAEPFPTRAVDALEPGEVLIIDEDNPGHLKRSERGYDSRVAGIVSGAGGVKPGLTLRQHDVMEGSTQVALTGRVYVKADCSHGRIKPGDLLTTSLQPGHAARASDSLRSTGAVIGKAMTALDQGEGLVLVLVSLQ